MAPRPPASECSTARQGLEAMTKQVRQAKRSPALRIPIALHLLELTPLWLQASSPALAAKLLCLHYRKALSCCCYPVFPRPNSSGLQLAGSLSLCAPCSMQLRWSREVEDAMPATKPSNLRSWAGRTNDPTGHEGQ